MKTIKKIIDRVKSNKKLAKKKSMLREREREENDSNRQQ